MFVLIYGFILKQFFICQLYLKFYHAGTYLQGSQFFKNKLKILFIKKLYSNGKSASFTAKQK